jgi:hypothetical protein
MTPEKRILKQIAINEKLIRQIKRKVINLKFKKS